jgi:hypothetical protein
MLYKSLSKREVINWLDFFTHDIIKESIDDFNFNFDSYKTTSIDDLREIRTNIGRELQLIDNKMKLLTKIPEGINSKDVTCFLQMPEEILNHIRNWDNIKKSPYSCSLYSENEIGWNHKPDGCFSVSDHWNFYLQGKYHKITDKMVINNTHITLCRFNNNLKPIDGYLIQKRIEEGIFTEEEIGIYDTKGMWEVVLSLPKDTTKIDKIEELRQEKNKLRNLLKYLREINSKKDNTTMNTIKNFNEFDVETFEGKTEDGNIKRFNAVKDATIAKNKEYNFEPIPDKFRDKDPNYQYTISKKIEIGTKDPVKKFKEWNGNFWRKKKDRKKKYEPKAK